jgi:hypothetical protein
MSKWIAKLKELKNTVLDRDNETYSESITTSSQLSAKLTQPDSVTLLDICVPDGLEVSQSFVTLLNNSTEKNLNKYVPDGPNPPYTEVSQNPVTLVDTSQGKGKHQGVTIPPRPETLPRLPFALERLVSAASSDQLTGFSFDGVLDINGYVRAWACAYLVGDQQHAIDRLHQVQMARELSR